MHSTILLGLLKKIVKFEDEDNPHHFLLPLFRPLRFFIQLKARLKVIEVD
jgi:hypothetical protein